MEKNIKSFDGTKINYNISISKNNGTYLIFIHGAGGDLTAWRKVRDFFHKKEISTVAIDLRGHGKSGRPNLVKDYNLDNFAKDVHEVIKHEKIRRFILIGHCFGGMVTIMFHKLFPLLAKSYILIGTTYEAPSRLKIIFKNRIFFNNIINRFLGSKNLRKKQFSHANFKKFVGTSDYDIKRIYSDITHTSLKSWLFTYQNMADFDGIKILENMKQRVLIIEGEKDSIFNVLKAKKIYSLVKDSELDIIPNENHIIVINNPKILERKIYSFIKRIE